MGVEDWKGDYILRFEGVNTGCPLVTGARVRRWMRELAGRTPGRLRSLNYPGTPASFALVLKNANLLVPEMAHLGGLDVTDPVAREASVVRWDFKSMSREMGLRLFGLRTFPGQFDKKKLIRNIIFQVWRWIRLGIRPPIHNIVRRGWYECVKPVLQNWRILEAPDYDRYFQELRELTRMKVLGVTYRDFGFLDYEEGLYFGVGSERPDILLYTEKSEAKRFVDEILDRLKASYIVNHGQPNRFRVESVALDIADRVPGQVVHLVSLVDFNPGGFAIEAAGVEGLVYHDVPVQVHRVLELRALSPDEVEEFKAPLVEVIRYDDGRVEFTMGNPSYVTQCENWDPT